jgi:hypothetical protein
MRKQDDRVNHVAMEQLQSLEVVLKGVTHDNRVV